MKMNLKGGPKATAAWYELSESLGREDEKGATKLFVILARVLCDLFVERMK